MDCSWWMVANPSRSFSKNLYNGWQLMPALSSTTHDGSRNMQWRLDGQVHNAAARIGQHKLQQAAACDCNRAVMDLKGTQAQLDKELATAHPHTPPHDLVVDAAFWQEMGIESINAPTTLSEPMFWPDVTNSLVMEPLAETCDLPDCCILKISSLESDVRVAKSKDGVMVGGTLASTYVLHCKVFTLLLRFSQFTKTTITRYSRQQNRSDVWEFGLCIKYIFWLNG